MAFQKMNVVSSKRYTSDEIFFSINRFNGGYLSAGLRNLLGRARHLDIEYNPEEKVLRFKVSNEGIEITGLGVFKLSSEVRQRYL